jgi:hypothetical protein
MAFKGGTIVAALTLQQLQAMQEEVEKSQADDLVIYFLMLFERGKPLSRDALDEWRLQNIIKLDRIKSVANDAVKFGWITSTPEGMFITEEGLKKAEER